MTREIVSFLVGQGGNQVGREFWKQLCQEHFLDGQGYAQTTPHLQQLIPFATVPIDSRDVYFSSTWNQNDVERYLPRAILMDTEPNVLNKGLAHSFCRELFRYQNIYIHPENSSAGNNWFLGYDLVAMNQNVFNELFEITQKELELTDNLGGFQFLHSLAGGTGSGSGSALIELLLHDHYPKKDIVSMAIFDDLSVPTVSTGTYNTTLTLARLIEHCQAVIPIDNAYYYNIMPQILTKMDLVDGFGSVGNGPGPGQGGSNQPQQQQNKHSNTQAKRAQLANLSQDDINFLIAQMLSQVTMPLRYSHLNTNHSSFTLPQLLQQSSTHPRCHFYTTNTIPVPHRLANLPSLLLSQSNTSGSNPTQTGQSNIQGSQNGQNPAQNTQNNGADPSQPYIPDLEAARRAGIILPPSYIEKLTNTAQKAQKGTNTANFIPWLQSQSSQYQDLLSHINTTLQALPSPPPFNYALSPTFTTQPPVPTYRLGLAEGYNSLFNHDNLALYSAPNNPTPPGKYLNLSLYHSYNQQPASLPKALQYHLAKQHVLNRYELNFIQNDPGNEQFQTLMDQIDKLVPPPHRSQSHYNTNNGHQSLQTNTHGSVSGRGNGSHSFRDDDDEIDDDLSPSSSTPPLIQLATDTPSYIHCHSFITPQMQILTQLLPHTDFSTLAAGQNNQQGQNKASNPSQSGLGGGSGLLSGGGGGGMAGIGMAAAIGKKKHNQPTFNFDSLVLIANNTNIRHYLNRVTHHCVQLYNRGAWVNQYCAQSVYFNKKKFLKSPKNPSNRVNTTSKQGVAKPKQQTTIGGPRLIGQQNQNDSIGQNPTLSEQDLDELPHYTAYIEMERCISIVSDVSQEYLYLEKHYATDPHKSFQRPFNPEPNQFQTEQDQYNFSPGHGYYHDDGSWIGPDPREAYLEPNNVQQYLSLLQSTIKRNKPNVRSLASALQPRLLARGGGGGARSSHNINNSTNNTNPNPNHANTNQSHQSQHQQPPPPPIPVQTQQHPSDRSRKYQLPSAQPTDPHPGEINDTERTSNGNDDGYGDDRFDVDDTDHGQDNDAEYYQNDPNSPTISADEHNNTAYHSIHNDYMLADTEYEIDNLNLNQYATSQYQNVDQNADSTGQYFGGQNDLNYNNNNNTNRFSASTQLSHFAPRPSAPLGQLPPITKSIPRTTITTTYNNEYDNDHTTIGDTQPNHYDGYSASTRQNEIVSPQYQPQPAELHQQHRFQPSRSSINSLAPAISRNITPGVDIESQTSNRSSLFQPTSPLSSQQSRLNDQYFQNSAPNPNPQDHQSQNTSQNDISSGYTQHLDNSHDGSFGNNFGTFDNHHSHPPTFTGLAPQPHQRQLPPTRHTITGIQRIPSRSTNAILMGHTNTDHLLGTNNNDAGGDGNGIDELDDEELLS